MNKLKTTDVWVVTDDTNETYEGIITGLKKQSLYCFTREELESLLKDTWLGAINYEFDDSPHPSHKTFLNNLFNDK